MTTLFQSLGYNYDNSHGSITELSTETKKMLTEMPPLIEPWQAQDLANNSVNGYLQNPVSPVSLTIKNAAISIQNSCSTANGLQGSTGAITALFANIVTTNLSDTAQAFIDHTDRLSGIKTYDDYINDTTGITSTKPFYNTAINYGKSVMYIVNQTDGIVNNAPIMGSFTSLFVKPDLDSLYSLIQTYPTLIQNSITITTETGGTIEEPTTSEVATSSLTLSQVTAINNTITTTKNLMNTRKTHDENYYTNIKKLVTDYNNVRQFSNMGDTQTSLVNDFIGTDKIKSRINS